MNPAAVVMNLADAAVMCPIASVVNHAPVMNHAGIMNHAASVMTHSAGIMIHAVAVVRLWACILLLLLLS